MRRLKIDFVDFWPDFKKESNYFVDLLSKFYQIEISSDPEILFYSNFGADHLNYKCYRFFYSSENTRPNMYKSDLAFTFDISDHKRHFRLPLFVLYAHKYKKSPEKLNALFDENAIQNWSSRKFCCMVVSNEKSKERIRFFNYLSKKEQIDSGGKVLNNIGGPVADKLKFISNYKFVIAFENSKRKGYTTEKIIDPFLVNSIPIYWGNPAVETDIFPESFIYINDSSEYAKIYNKLKEIENNIGLALRILSSKKVYPEKEYWDEMKIFEFIENYISKNKTPISKKRYFFILGMIIDKMKVIKYLIIKYTFGHFR